MPKRTIILQLRKYSNTGLYIFAQAIHDGVQSRPALYPSPVPSFAVLQTAIDKMKSCIEHWGTRGNAGGAKEKAALQQAREVLSGHIESYARYVMAVQPENFQSWLELGFTLKKLPAKAGRMEAVQDFHQFIARNIRPGEIKLKWWRPLGAPPALIITYNIYRSPDEHFANAVLIGTTVNKATYIDRPPKAGVIYNYWVIPVTAAGDGVPSETCMAFASPL